MNVVHIKDSVCTLPTSILAQYLKQANGQLSCLKVSLIPLSRLPAALPFSPFCAEADSPAMKAPPDPGVTCQLR